MPQECSGEGKEVALAFLLFKNVLEGFVSVGCSRWCVYICCYCCCCLLSLVPWSQHEDAAREQLQGHTAHLVLRQWRHMCLQPNETIAIVIAASCGHNSPTGCRSRTAVMTVREQCSFPESMALLWSMASASCLRMLRTGSDQQSRRWWEATCSCFCIICAVVACAALHTLHASLWRRIQSLHGSRSYCRIITHCQRFAFDSAFTCTAMETEAMVALDAEQI